MLPFNKHTILQTRRAFWFDGVIHTEKLLVTATNQHEKGIMILNQESRSMLHTKTSVFGKCIWMHLVSTTIHNLSSSLTRHKNCQLIIRVVTINLYYPILPIYSVVLIARTKSIYTS